MGCVVAENISVGCTTKKYYTFYMIITQVTVMVLLPRWRLHPLHKLLMILCPGILQGLLDRVGQRIDGTNRCWSYTQRRKTNAASANLQSTLLVCVHSGCCDGF